MTEPKEKKPDKPEIRTRQAGRLKPAGDMFSRVRLPDEPHPMAEMFAAATAEGAAATPAPAPVDTPVDTAAATGAGTGASGPAAPVDTPVATPAEAPVSSPAATAVAPERPERATQPQYLDATHTGSEQKVYSVMYRETISRGVRERHFGNKELREKTGIRSDLTVRKAIRGLKEKLSIEVVSHAAYFPMGPRYRVYEPREVMRRRRAAGLEVDPQTKKVTTPVATTVGTTAATPVATPVDTGVAAGDKNYRTDSAETTGVGPVETTGQSKLGNEIGGREVVPASSSSESISADDENDALVSSVRSIYERLTGNTWTTADELTLAEGQGIRAEAWGLALCQCVERAPGHVVPRLAYALGEAKNYQEVAGHLPAEDLRMILRRSVDRIARARETGVWNLS